MTQIKYPNDQYLQSLRDNLADALSELNATPLDTLADGPLIQARGYIGYAYDSLSLYLDGPDEEPSDGEEE